MKKVLFLVCLAALLVGPGSAFAEGITLDVGGILGTEPAEGLGTDIGFTVGGSYDISEALQVRVDVSYISWDDEATAVVPVFGTVTAKTELTRIPIFLGVRYNLPAKVTVFFEGGLEVSLDDYEVSLSNALIGTISVDESETNIGITPGVGVSYLISDTVLIGANARYHIISDAYFSLGVFVYKAEGGCRKAAAFII
jgi:opacity protein-like surface antigen